MKVVQFRQSSVQYNGLTLKYLKYLYSKPHNCHLVTMKGEKVKTNLLSPKFPAVRKTNPEKP